MEIIYLQSLEGAPTTDDLGNECQLPFQKGYSGAEGYLFVTDEGVLAYCPPNSYGSYKLVTRQEALELLNKNGHNFKYFDWEVLNYYNEFAQRVFEMFGKTPEQIYEIVKKVKLQEKEELEKKMEVAKNKVISTLFRISKKFPLAKQLINAIDEYGLFNGIVRVYDEWEIKEWSEDDDPKTWCHLEKGTPTMTFACIRKNNYWQCRVEEGKHFVVLTFSIPEGDLYCIYPDDNSSEHLWIEDTRKNRVQEIKELLK